MSMSCCTNPQDLGCIRACEGIATSVTADCAGVFTLSFEHNGAVITRQLLSNGSGGFLTVPGNTFNEGSETTFSISTSAGVELACYKVKVLAQESNIYTDVEPWGTISSSVFLDNAVCAPILPSGSVWSVSGAITLNDINLIDDGTEITIGALYNPAGGVTGISYTAVSAGISIANNVMTIVDKSQIGGNTIYYAITFDTPNCTPVNWRNYVACYSFLPVGVAVGNQLISNAI